MSLEEGLQTLGLFTAKGPSHRHRRYIQEWLWKREEMDCAASLKDLSLAAWMDQPWDNDAFDSPSASAVEEVLVMDGYDSIVEAMAETLPTENCIHFNTIVQVIRLVSAGDSSIVE
eukprot:15071753-Ditylum_brightwellii.AAC.1